MCCNFVEIVVENHNPQAITNKPNHNIDTIIYLPRFGEYNFALTTKNLGRAGRQADRRTDTGR